MSDGRIRPLVSFRSSLAAALIAPASIVLAFTLAQPAAGAGVATLQARVDQAQGQARSLAASVELRTAELNAAASRANAAGRRQQALEGALVQGKVRLAQLRGAAKQTHLQLLAAQARFRRAQGLLGRRLVSIYKSDSPDMATILLEADGFNDLLTRTAYLEKINAADNELVRRVQALRDEVRQALERVRQLRRAAAAEVVQIAAAREEVARIRVAAEQRAVALTRARAAQQASLAALRSRMAGWTAQVRALQTAAAQPGNAGQTVGQWLGDFAIPKSVVLCESGGNYRAVNPNSGAGGAYQFLPDTYKGLGGRYKAPQFAPKWEQDQLAAKLWNGGAGRGNWEC